MPWDKKEAAAQKNNPTYSTVSAVAAYRVKTNQDRAGNNVYELQRLWIKTFPLQIGCLHWSDSEETIYIGFDKGVIHRLALTNNPLAYNDVSTFNSK